MGRADFDRALGKYLQDGTIPSDIVAGEYEVEITKGKLVQKNDTEFFMLICQVLSGEFDGAEFLTTYFLRPQNIPELVRVLGGFGVTFTCYDDLKNGAFAGYRARVQVSIETRDGVDDDGKPTQVERTKIDKAIQIKKTAATPGAPRAVPTEDDGDGF